jgi:gliding motility-associated-like protein
MKKLILLTAFFAMTAFMSTSQVCNVFVSPQDTTICPGDSVCITAIASITATGQSFDFDAGALPPGWSTAGGATWGTPCGQNPTNTPYYWASTAGAGTPQVSTAAFDISCGGVVTFDMVYSIQGQSSPCEGPDLANEGVELQYSLDGGLTWITIVYFQPDGVQLPANPNTSNSVASGVTPYTSWGTFTIPIPPGAMSTSTMFQWIQTNSSGSSFDNWGLDNISIDAGPCNSAVVNWDNGLQNTNAFCASPSQDTAFVALVYDTLGNFQCSSDTITITIIGDNMTYDLVDSAFVFCPDDSAMVEILNIQGAQLPVTTDWSTGSTTTDTWLPGNGLKQDTIWYYVDLLDGCGYTRVDSVVLLVNQTLTIDSLMQFPASACAPDGAVTAFVSGETNLLGQSYYHWDDQANWDNFGTGSFIDATAWQNIGSGWYFFTVSDDVCTESDSIFVEMNNPPIASVTATPDNGCNPVSVTLSNDSQNSNEYYWDFGNGNTASVSDMGSQNQIYSQSSIVMLIAYSDPTCADTAYVNISVTPCGCTDPEADNYDPSATFDDGSCTYPIPVVTPPNVFTPNGDGDNDVYFLDTKNVVKLEYTILNRWGNVMFDQTVDLTLGFPEIGWNGTTPLGIEAQEGTYYYKYVATGINGDQVDGHGFIQLVRD